MQYEGEESSNNVFYTGAAPNQQAIPAVEYLMSAEGGNVKRWVLEGTDYVYPRTTNKILEAFLKSKGVAAEDIKINYTPFGFSDWQTEVAAIKSFASAGKKTAVVSTINGDANVPFYKELANAGIKASDIPVVAFSVGEEELAGIDTKNLVGHLAAWNYFQSVKNPTNEAFIKQWHDFIKNPKRVTNDPMEATTSASRCGRMRSQQAGTTDVDAVRQAMYGQKVQAPSGFGRGDEHQPSPVEAGDDRRNPAGRAVRRRVADQGARSRPTPGARILAGRQGQDRRLDLSLGLRQLHRAKYTGLSEVARRPRGTAASRRGEPGWRVAGSLAHIVWEAGTECLQRHRSRIAVDVRAEPGARGERCGPALR